MAMPLTVSRDRELLLELTGLKIGQHRRVNGGAEECQTIDQYAPDRIPENDEYTQRRGKQHSDQVVDKVHRTIARHQCLLGQ